MRHFSRRIDVLSTSIPRSLQFGMWWLDAHTFGFRYNTTRPDTIFHLEPQRWTQNFNSSWLHHVMGTLSAFLTLGAGNPCGKHKWPVMRPFDISFDISPNKLVNQQSSCQYVMGAVSFFIENFIMKKKKHIFPFKWVGGIPSTYAFSIRFTNHIYISYN